MPTLNSHTHCQAAQTNAQTQAWQRVCLFQRTTKPTMKLTDEQKARCPNSVYVAIAGEVVTSRSVHLINFCDDGKVIALKSPTALILDRCASCKKKDT
jgi:hypothetical protein